MGSPKILIVGPAWVGDMVMAQSVCAILQQRFHEPVIDILAPSWSAPIIARMPGVNNAIVHSFQHGVFDLKGRRQLGHQLRQQHYDQAIVIPRSWKSALVPWFAKIPIRTGYLGEQRHVLLNDIRRSKKNKRSPMLERLSALVLTTAELSDWEIPYPTLLTQDVTAAIHRHAIANRGGQSIFS